MRELAQLLGTCFVAALGCLALYISIDESRWRTMGQQALALFGVYQFYFVFTRTLSQLGIVGHEMSVVLGGLGAGVAVCLLVNLVGLHVLARRYGIEGVRL